MKFNRRVHIVATLFLALFLFTTNAYANSLSTYTGPNGSVSPLGKIVGDSGTVSVTPNALYQVDKVRLYEGTKVNSRLKGTFPDDCPADDGPYPRDCSYGGINISYTYNGLGVTFSYSGLGADYAMAASFALAPVAGFVIDGASPPSGSEEPDVTVQFNDTSTNSPSALSWDFGDGGTSTSPNPLHTFTAAGTYPVTLKVYNLLGQETDSYSLDYTVKVPTIAYQASAGANGSITPSGTVVVNEGSSTVFTFDPDPLYQVADILVDGVSIGAVTSVTFGSADIDDHTITASFEPIPVVASFSGPSGEITTDDQVQFTDNSTPQGNLTFWNWYIGTELISTEQNPVLTFTEAGDYTVTLEVGNAATSASTDPVVYTVNANNSSSPIVREGEGSSQGYTSLQDAYNGITGASETIKMKVGELNEDLFFDEVVTVMLKGGYDDSFGIDAGYTKIKGIVRILHGKVVVSKVIVAPAF